MKRLGVTLVVLAGVLLAADFLVRAAAENAAANLIDEQVSQRIDPEVRLGGFPFLLSLVRGSFDEVRITVPEMSKDSMKVEDIRLTLEDVKLEALEVLAGRGNLFAKSVGGRGIISEATINEVIGSRSPGVQVSIEKRRITVSRDGIEAPASAVVAGNRLLISAGEAMGALELPLPVLLEEVRFSSLSAEPGRLVLGVIGSRVRVRT